MGNSNKYADGLQYLLFPGNIGFGACGYNFPESTAQDLDGGAVSLSFSGSVIPFAGPTSSAFSYRYGPSGFATRFTPLAVLTGCSLFPSAPANLKGFVIDFTPAGIRALNKFNAPDLRTIYKVSEIAAVEAGAARNDDGSITTERFKNSRAFNTIAEVQILDLISEGPIEGFVSGIYLYNLSGKTTGDIGYTNVTFQPYTQSNPETRSIIWNDTPLTDQAGFFNFQYADYKFTYGEKSNDHTIYNPYINLYEDRYNYFGQQVDINKIPLETSVTKSIGDQLYGFYTLSGLTQILSPKTYYIYNTDVSAIKVNIKLGSLYENILTGLNAGDVERQLATFRFLVSRVLKNGEKVVLDTSKYFPYIRNYYSYDEIAAYGKIAQSPCIITYEITLRPYAENSPSFGLLANQIGWAIDIVKSTRESINAGIGNASYVDSITEVYSDRFVYPDTALVFSKFDARYFNEIPSRSYNVRLLKVKVPINYDPITKKYIGPWNGQFKVAWTDNPAWCFYDLITNNRYGLGKYIDSTLTDKWTLYEIGQYCDQFVPDGVGGLEPRFRCNLYINTKEEAYKVLNDMASIFRAIVYYSAGQITVSQDSLKEPIYIFNNSNVINGDFNYSDSSKKSRKTVAFVRYNDENDNYKPAIEYVENKEAILKYGIRETQISAFGCTSKNQAKRMGKWVLATDNSETEIVDFQAGLEGIFLKPGDIISIYDQNRKNQVYGGRTLELTNSYGILDIKANASNLNFLTGVLNDFKINILTPTYNLNPGTQIGDMYITGTNVTSSGTTGINDSFLRRSQVQSIQINNPSTAIASGNGIYSTNVKVTFPTLLDNINYNLPQNTTWTIDLNEYSYNFNKSPTIRSPINNPGNTLYPGYYLEPYMNKPKKYRILNISEKEDSIFSINALEYNDKKYEDIDDIGELVNVPIKVASPVEPTLFLSGIFRSPTTNSYCTTSPCNGTHYTTNQGGINSIMYNIRPPSNSQSNSLYYVYAKPYIDYINSTETPEQYLVSVLSPQNLRTGLTPMDWSAGTIPPFLTPTGAGIYYFRVFSENSIGERSFPINSSYNLTAQASVFTVQASGFNIY